MAIRLSRWFCFGLAVAIATAASCCSKSGSKSSPTATDEQPMVAPTLAPAPTSCAGPKPHREKVSPDLAPLAGQRPVWAGFYAPLDVKSGTLTAAGEPREFPSYLYFAASGCYELHASWPGGGWKMVLGVGR